MNNVYEEDLKRLWSGYGPIDLFNDFESLATDIQKRAELIEPCRKLIASRNKLKSYNNKNSYDLKSEFELILNIGWLPHSIFIFSAFLEGIKIKAIGKINGAWVFETNIGKWYIQS
nr:MULTISPECIES: hypothetical protein [Providencia]